jgi:hypothetical protein
MLARLRFAPIFKGSLRFASHEAVGEAPKLINLTFIDEEVHKFIFCPNNIFREIVPL